MPQIKTPMLTVFSSARMSRRALLRFSSSAILAVVLGIGLAGCASPNVSASATIEAGQGVAALRVISLHDYQLKRLWIINLDTGEDIKLEPQYSLGGDSARFVAVLKAGQYQLNELHAEDVLQNGLTEIISAPLKRASTQFSVESGQLTNLGSLIFAPMGGNRFVAPREDTPVAARQWLEAVNPVLAGKLAPGKELSWTQPSSSEERASVERLTARPRSITSQLRTEVGVSNAGSWVGGRLGAVSDASKGSTYRTGSVHPITSAVPLQDGRVLAAGEENYVAVTSADRATWKEVPAPVSQASVAVLVTQAPGGNVYLVTRTPSGYAAFEASPANFAWREIRQDKLGLPGALGAGVQAVATGERLVIYAEEVDQLLTFEFRTRKWEARTLKNRLYVLRGTQDGLLYGRQFGGDFATSDDYGASWQPMERYARSLFPVFISREVGYIAARPFTLGKLEPLDLYKSIDGGRSWTVVGGMPYNPRLVWFGRMAWDERSRRIGIEWEDGRHYWTEDEGKSWR